MLNIFKISSPKFFVPVLSLALLLQSCSETADKFFGIAVLNTNTITDFGTPILAKHINDQTKEYPDIPSSKKKGDEAVTYLNNKVLYMEKSLKDIKELGASNEARKDIKAKSIAVYEYVIPVYKNEYMVYAKLCDSKASQEEKDKLINSIEEKYNAEFEQKFSALLESGKAFAKDNNLNVTWH